MKLTPNIVVFGVSGCGKSTIGTQLSSKIGLPFFDADDFHPPENIAKMASGVPLSDSDRYPWLSQIGEVLAKKPKGWILACSVLKESYRKIISEHVIVDSWVFLEGDFDRIFTRIKSRDNHFMKARMLQSQFEVLEIPAYAFSISIEYPPSEIINLIIENLSE